MRSQRMEELEHQYIAETTAWLQWLARRVFEDAESLTPEEEAERDFAVRSLSQVLEAKGLAPSEMVKLVLGHTLRPDNTRCDCLSCRSRKVKP